jgi:hypothetical protein
MLDFVSMALYDSARSFDEVASLVFIAFFGQLLNPYSSDFDLQLV